MIATSPFEAQSRWPGAPRICVATNMPAFATLKDYADFEKTNCPGLKVIFKWKCSRCRCYHVWAVGSDPAGASSGTGRTSKLTYSDDYENSLRLKFGLQLCAPSAA